MLTMRRAPAALALLLTAQAAAGGLFSAPAGAGPGPLEAAPGPLPALPPATAGAEGAVASFLAAPPRDNLAALALAARAAGAALAVPEPQEVRLEDALEALFAAHGVPPSPAEREALRALEAWPPAAQAGLALVLGAAAEAQRAAKAAFAGLAPEEARALAGTVLEDPVEAALVASAIGKVDRGALLRAQAGLVRAVLAALPALEAHALDLPPLDGPWTDAGPATGPGPSITVAHVLAIDPRGSDTYYGKDFAVIVDLVGHDTYRNAAGGSGRSGGPDAASGQDLLASIGNAGVMVDLYGDDRHLGYVPAIAAGGINGGGYLGLGFLFDLHGDDAYGGELLARGALNGGAASAGAGLLWDVAGDDTYAATLRLGGGANGGGAFGGIGLLRDEDGHDAYHALADGRWAPGGGYGALNGGGQFLGVGLLLDDAGDDARWGHVARMGGVNGGGWGGVGLLLDLLGDDAYDGWSFYGGAVNGAGGSQGSGALLDLQGDDVYAALLSSGGAAANGAGNGGSGALVDQHGDDRYEVVVQTIKVAANGGGRGGSGSLRDAAGDDRYLVTLTAGAGQAALNGGALEGGAGSLVDLRGDDAYLVTFLGPVTGLLAANGGGSAGHGLLLDAGGRDRYADRPGAAPGADETQAPKGTGLQLDIENPWGV